VKVNVAAPLEDAVFGDDPTFEVDDDVLNHFNVIASPAANP